MKKKRKGHKTEESLKLRKPPSPHWCSLFSTTGGVGKEAEKFHKRLGERVLEKEFLFFICHIQQSIHKYKIHFCLMNSIQNKIR
jgi:hypothetical protein